MVDVVVVVAVLDALEPAAAAAARFAESMNIFIEGKPESRFGLMPIGLRDEGGKPKLDAKLEGVVLVDVLETCANKDAAVVRLEPESRGDSALLSAVLLRELLDVDAVDPMDTGAYVNR